MEERQEITDQEMQEKYLKIELLNKEYEQLYNQINYMNSRTEELSDLKESLNNIENSESYSQLGLRVFVATKITDKDTFLVNIGKRLYVKMNKEKVKDFLERKINDLKYSASQLSQRKNELEKLLQKEVSELQSCQYGSHNNTTHQAS